MEDKVKDWPIQPSFLSIQKGINRNDSAYSPNRDGLFRTDELRGFLADASDDKDIDNVLALFQVVPSDFEVEDNDEPIFETYLPENYFIKKILNGRKIARIFPGKLFDNIHPCKLFRECTPENENKCFELDSRIALLYDKDLGNIHFETNFEKFFEKLCSIVQACSEYLPLEVIKCPDGKHLYVKYQCPYSTLEEYFFPVIYSGKIIAVLMQGQRFPKNFDPEKMFTECIQNCNSEKQDEFKESIGKLTSISKKESNREAMSDKRQTAILERIARLEERIKDAIDASAQKYVTTQFSKIEEDFRKDIKEIDEKKPDALEQFKQKLNHALENIFNTFNKEGFIRIFAIRPPIEDADPNTDEFDLIGDSSGNIDTSKYDLLKFRTIQNKRNGKGKDELLKDIIDKLNGFHDNDVFRMDVPFAPRMAYIVWKRYDNWGEKYESQKEIYGAAMKSMYHTLLEPFFILHGIKLEEQLETSMRVTGHEVAQVIPAVIRTINTMESLESLDNGNKYSGNALITKSAHKILDASRRLMLLENLFRRSRLIFKNDFILDELEWTDFHRIIYATQSLFQEKAQHQNIQNIIITLPSDMRKYQLKTHYGYLSHILFNLVDNAIKYSFRGTRIEIDVREEYESVIQNIFEREYIKKIIISVINYGNQIEEEERKKIFNLYYRPENSQRVEGMGIGLFLVKKLCNLMNYEVECKPSKLIENYNIAVKHHYTKQNPPFAEDPSLDSDLIRLLSRNVSEGNMKIINQSNHVEWKIGLNELKALIHKPVYRNEFQITIPIKTINTVTNNKYIDVEYDHLKKY